jgi:hypothetical protein
MTRTSLPHQSMLPVKCLSWERLWVENARDRIKYLCEVVDRVQERGVAQSEQSALMNAWIYLPLSISDKRPAAQASFKTGFPSTHSTPTPSTPA